MEIASQNVRLRPAGPADAALLERWWNDGAVMAHAGFPLGLGITREQIEKDLSTDSDETRRRWILEYEDRPIGEMSHRILPGQKAEIGIKICEEEYQEKGLGRIALSLLIRFLFDAGCKKIVLDTNLNNRRAQHVYEKLGFRQINVRIDSWTDQLGRKQSAVDYELERPWFVDWTIEGEKKMDQIKRIESMEKNLDKVQAAVGKLSSAFEEYEQAQDAYKALNDYYGSSQWMEDYEDDEAGKLPSDLKRGVLSEDAVYDLLTENHDLMLRMLKIITRALEEGMLS